LAGGYDIDGLHLDYVRFPDSSYSYDLGTIVAYRVVDQSDSVSFADWRRDNLTRFVGDLSYAVRRVNPRIRVSAAVWQKIDQGRLLHFQDGAEWIRRGYLDFVVPMIYTVDARAFEERLGTYRDLVGAANVVAGLGPYLDGFTDSLVVQELSTAERYGVRGFSIFNSEYALKYGSVIRRYMPEE
jgi:hypothetical protein